MSTAAFMYLNRLHIFEGKRNRGVWYGEDCPFFCTDTCTQASFGVPTNGRTGTYALPHVYQIYGPSLCCPSSSKVSDSLLHRKVPKFSQPNAWFELVTAVSCQSRIAVQMLPHYGSHNTILTRFPWLLPGQIVKCVDFWGSGVWLGWGFFKVSENTDLPFLRLDQQCTFTCSFLSTGAWRGSLFSLLPFHCCENE